MAAPTPRALTRLPRATAAPANRVTVLDPDPPPGGGDQPPSMVYVHIDAVHLTQPVAPSRAPARAAAPRRHRARRRGMHPAMRALVVPIVVLVFAICAVYVARLVLTDPALFAERTQQITR